jgi:hypothetical protein
MPWTPKDAGRHDKKATSPIAKRQWSDVANAVLEKTGDEGRAVREANGAVMKREIGKYRGKLSETRSGKRKRIERNG